MMLILFAHPKHLGHLPEDEKHIKVTLCSLFAPLVIICIYLHILFVCI